DDVVMAFFSEFGRMSKGNGRGTDHGDGYPLTVIGGKIKGQVYGEIEDLNTLNTLVNHRNAWPREVASERIVVDILEKHLKIDPRLAFPEPYYSSIPKAGD